MCAFLPGKSGTVSDVLIDTDVFVDHLRGARRLNIGANRVSYSVVTRCELFAGAHDQEEPIQLLLAPFRELTADRVIAERAGRLRRQFQVRIADALIGATALEHGLELVTRNLRDFAAIPNLTVRQPD